jgi:acetolactate synthase-1/2/3 large subunit
LVAAGVGRLFTLSGNQIMAVFDACIETGIDLVHVRHEAAAVHMADAWGRLTGEPGVALVTAGPGFANTLSALYVATMAESPMVLLSGQAPSSQLGRGPFQEMSQADMAQHVTKSSWTADTVAGLGGDLARALRTARSGRPGPVHVALPVDLLEAQIERETAMPTPEEFDAPGLAVDSSSAQQIVDALATARRPLVLAGPAMMRGERRDALSSLGEAAQLPVVAMESPRGVNDPSLGAFAEVLPEADLILLLGKKLDFSVGQGKAPAVGDGCRFIQVDADPATLEQTRRTLADPARLPLAYLADPASMARQIAGLAGSKKWSTASWRDEVAAAVAYRPADWGTLTSASEGPVHPVELCRVLQEFLDGDDWVLVSDGGEFGQWAQACLSAPHRIINGPSGSIGSAIPLSLAARLAFPESPVVAVLGDGTFGFHAMEMDTAVRSGLPVVTVVGNDATWNAEYQIQLRDYGADRLVGCELLPTRYDQVVSALGGHGEHVTTAAELRPALERAFGAGRPACVNVDLQRCAAPTIRRKA